MLRIRLRKPGKSIKRRYHWKIVVAEGKTARESKFVAQIGYYDPSKKVLKIELEKYEKWVKSGAKPSVTVASLAKRYKKQQAAK